MPRKQMMLLLPLFFVTSCGPWFGQATRPPTVLTQVELAPRPVLTNLSCPERPSPQAVDMQRDAATYVRELVAWGEQCKAKLAEVNEALRGATP